MSLVKEYLELTKRFKDEYGELTIVLMQNGAFFEVYALKDENNNIHGCSLVEFSRLCDLNIADKHFQVDGYKVVMAGFKTHLIEKYIRKLQDAGYTITVYEEDSEEADAISKKKNRSLTGIYSPGTFFSSEPENITNITCCIWIEVKKPNLKSLKKHIYIGISQIDIYTGTSSMMEYNETHIMNPCTFDELERFISVYKPNETIFVSSLPRKELLDIVSFANIQSNAIHYVSLDESNISKNTLKALNCEKQTYQTQLLDKFYKINDINAFMGLFGDNVYATQSFCYLLDFIYQHNPNLVYKIGEPVLENASNKLVLANHSLKQLNIIDDDNYKGKYSSVVKMLNECITPMGKREFAYKFLNPVTDTTYLQNEYDIVEKLLLNPNEYGIVKNTLSPIKDIAKIMRQIMLVKVTPRSIYHLYNGLSHAKLLYNYAVSKKHLYNYLEGKMGGLNDGLLISNIDNVLTYLASVLNIDACESIDVIHKVETSFIREGVDADLDIKIKTLMDSQDQLEACRSYFSSVIGNYETPKTKKTTTKKPTTKKSQKTVSQIQSDNEFQPADEQDDDDPRSFVKIHETDKNNFSLIATERRCKILEESIKNTKMIVLKYNSSYSKKETQFTLSLELDYIKQSSNSKTITSSQIQALCKNMGSIKANLIESMVKVFQNIIRCLQDYQEELTNVINLITYMDVIYAKAYIAEKYNYCKPELASEASKKSGSNKSFVVAKDLRHCLIEKIQQTELYVANDIRLGAKDISALNEECLDGILLYGTNAVGKTSFIRALGISVVMAQAGLYVPASKFIFKPYKYIFTRILGNDNLFKGLSTFAVEMSELRTILRLADENSLVLGDELCSGTESISAVSIFVAGVQKMSSVGCSFIFATHLHEIIGYDEIVSLHNVGMKHMSVIYDKEKDCLVYNRKLEDGPGNNMYGLEVCKSLSLPSDFLENAHNIRMKYHPENASALEQKTSHYNAKHIAGGMCEKCNVNVAADVHHLVYQNEANERGIIKKNSLTFNKNIKANLLNLCQKCHDEIHETNKKYKKTKTTKGIMLEEV